jgi:hypothetical protein
MLAVTELGGGLEKILKIWVKLSGPVTVSTLVRVSVRHRVVPCSRQATLRIMGYSVSTEVVRVLAEVDVRLKSVEQPETRSLTTTARVASSQAGAAHMLVSQALSVGTREVPAGTETTGMRALMARH